MAAAEPDNFFKQKRTTSEIKDKILPAYFKTWVDNNFRGSDNQFAKTLLYVDVNAGEGYTLAGQPTAPVLILESIQQNIQSYIDADQHIRTCFVNPTEAVAEKLKVNLEQLTYYPKLPDAPAVITEAAFQEQINSNALGNQPTLLFLDPARQVLTRQLLARSLQSSETDVLLVFNFNKLRQVLLAAEPEAWENTFWDSHLNQLNKNIQTDASAKRREGYFMQALEEVFKAKGFYTFKFNITAPVKNPASQYIFLATKNLRGYLGIKDIMQAYSEYQEDDVPLFQAANKPQTPLLPGFFQYLSAFTLDNLVAELAQNRSRFHYKTLQVIYEEHSIGTNYIKANYQMALERLQAEGVLYPINAQNKKVKAITDTSVIFYNLHRSKK